MKYTNKTEVVDAFRWFKNGDHPGDDVFRKFEDTGAIPLEPREGKVVRYFRHPGVNGLTMCKLCDNVFRNHGWVDSGGPGQPVCPGSFIVHQGGGIIVVPAAVWLKHYEPYADPAVCCVWSLDKLGAHLTQCGKAFRFNDGGPRANLFKSCPYCGRALVEAEFQPAPEVVSSAENQKEKETDMAKKPKNPGAAVTPPAAALPVGTILVPDQAPTFQMNGPSMQVTLNYRLDPGASYQVEGTEDGTTWQNVGAPIVVDPNDSPVFWGTPIIYAENDGYRIKVV